MGLSKEVVQKIGNNEVARFKSCREAAEQLGLTVSKVSKLCLNGKEYNGFVLFYSGNLTNAKIHKGGEFICPFCGKSYDSYSSLSKHVFKSKNEESHKITKEELFALFYNNGVVPTCKCGCGEKVKLSYEGGMHFSSYVFGHHNRVHNNWGHNPKAIKNSAITRAKQYKEGTRMPWNKGKKWNETFNDEQIKALKEKIYTEERNKKLSDTLKGRKLSESHVKKLREIANTEWFKELSRKHLIERISEQKFNISSKEEKEFINECIKPIKIEYKTQYYIKELAHYCDIYIPSKNLIIEFNGDYWHANPKKYIFQDLTERQKKQVKKDNLLRNYCSNNEIELLEIWESDYKNDVDSIKAKIRKIIEK